MGDLDRGRCSTQWNAARAGPRGSVREFDLDDIDAMTAAPNRPMASEPAGAGHELSACSGAELLALMVLGESMAPEFEHGDVIIIEAGGAAHDGSYVLALCSGQWLFRQLRREGDGWSLHAMAPGCEAVAIPDLGAILGVVIQKSRPGRRAATRRYVA